MRRLRLADWIYVWSGFDPDDYATDRLHPALRPVHRAYLYASVRVTGHSAHALNGLLVWLPLSWLIPLAWYWILPVAFYTAREVPDLIAGHGEWLDHLGDVVWVYAVAIALWLPPDWMLAFFCVVVVPVQGAYWMEPAPRWMPKDALLWSGKRRR